jgi:hypothetical protein
MYGTLEILNDTLGNPGNLECTGSLYSDSIIENTTGTGTNLQGTIFNNNNSITIQPVGTLNNPSTNDNTIYFQSGLLKSINSTGKVKIYNSNTNIGDIMTNNGTTDVTLSVGSDTQILSALSTQSTGLAWLNVVNNGDGNGSGNINTHTTKNFYAYESSMLSFTNSYVDIPFENETINNGFVNHAIFSTPAQITFLYPDTYLVTVKVSTSSNLLGSNGKAVSQIHVMENIANAGYTEVIGSLSGNLDIYNNSCGLLGLFGTTVLYSGSMISFYIKSYNAGDQIKAQIENLSGSGTMQTITNGCELGVYTIDVDDANDTTVYLDTYITANTTLTSTFATILFGTNRTTGSSYTHTSGSANVTINETGYYMIMCRIGVEKTSGTDSSQAEFNLTKNSTTIPGTYTTTFSSDSTTNFVSTGCIFLGISLTSGDVLALSGRIRAGTNLRTRINASSLCILKFQSSSNAQGTVKFFSGYDSVGGTSIGTSYTDIPLGSETTKNAIYTHSTSSNQQVIQVTENGRYYVYGVITLDNTTSTAAQSLIRLVVDPGTGTYSEIEGTLSVGYHVNTTTGRFSMFFCTTVELQSASNIKMQALGGVTGLTSVANGSSLTLVKTSVAETIPGSLVTFGSYFNSVSSLNVSTYTGTTFVQKLVLTTVLIPTGFYYIGVTYQTTTQHLSTQVIVDGSTTIYTKNLHLSSATDVGNGFSVIKLSQGVHIVSLMYAAGDGSTINISNAQLVMWRVY